MMHGGPGPLGLHRHTLRIHGRYDVDTMFETLSKQAAGEQPTSQRAQPVIQSSSQPTAYLPTYPPNYPVLRCGGTLWARDDRINKPGETAIFHSGSLSC